MLSHTGPDKEEVLLSTDSSEPNWTKFSQDLLMDKPFQVTCPVSLKPMRRRDDCLLTCTHWSPQWLSLSCELWPRPITKDWLPLMTSTSHQAAAKVILFIVLNVTSWIQNIIAKVWNYVVYSLAVNETGLAFVGCSFENDTCGWEDASVGQHQWARGNNTSSNGPSTDHTLGSKQGEETSFTAHLSNRKYKLCSWNKWIEL